MSFLTTITGLVTGSLPTVLRRVVDKVLPPTIPPEERAKIQAAISEAAHAHEIALLKAATEADAEFNRRTIAMEGTAADLKSVPVFGHIVLFLRGLIRPAFAGSLIVWDWQVLSGGWAPPDDVLFRVLNVLILGFFFGERAVKNVAPMLLAKIAPMVKRDKE